MLDELLLVVRAFPVADLEREGVLSAVIWDDDGFVLPERGVMVMLGEALVHRLRAVLLPISRFGVDPLPPRKSAIPELIVSPSPSGIVSDMLILLISWERSVVTRSNSVFVDLKSLASLKLKRISFPPVVVNFCVKA